MDNLIAEQKRQQEENRAREAQLRKEDEERLRRQMEDMEARHRQELEAAAQKSNSFWGDLGQLVGGFVGALNPVGRVAMLANAATQALPSTRR